MLTPFRVDTNSLAITERLNAIGYDVRLKAVVGDDVDELARCSSAASAAVDLDRLHRRPRPDRRRHHARRAGARARRAARRRRGDRRPHPPAVRAARDDDAGDQPAAGDGAARRDGRSRTRDGTAPGLVDRARRHEHRAAAGSAARNDADARSARSPIGCAAIQRRADCSGAC